MHRRRLAIIVAIPVALVVLVVGGTWLYLNVIRDDPPPRLTLEDADRTADPDPDPDPDSTAGGAEESTDGDEPGDDPDSAGDLSGTWVVGPGSQAGYRVAEILFGQSTEAVGRTEDVTGSFTLDGTVVIDATFEVDLRTVESDEERRDNQYRGRIMDVENHPTATFVLTEPFDLGELPDEGEQVAVTVTGDLTLRGTTRSATFELDARLAEGRVEIAGSTTIVFDDYGIPDPSNPVASVGDDGELELLLLLLVQEPSDTAADSAGAGG